jgi:hypothetical protein
MSRRASIGRCPAAAGRHARLGLVVELFDCINVCGIKCESVKHRARLRARFHEAIGNEQAARRFRGVGGLRQTGVGKMDVGETIVAVPPSFRGALDIAQHRWRYRLAVSGGQ